MAQFFNPCGPPPDPCRGPADPPMFNPGISIRRIPLCGPVACDCDTPSIGRARIGAGGTFDRTRWLEGWIYSQLVTRGEVSCTESPATPPRREGGWWADAFRRDSGASGFKSGSKLWSLRGSVVSNETLMTARAYATEALHYLQSWGIVSQIKIEASYVSRHVMRLAISVSGPGANAAVTVNGQALPSGSWIWSE